MNNYDNKYTKKIMGVISDAQHDIGFRDADIVDMSEYTVEEIEQIIEPQRRILAN